MVLKVNKKTRIHQLLNDTFIRFACWKKEKFKALSDAYKWAVIPICNTFLGARHSTDEVACFRPYPPGDSFLGANSGRLCRVLPVGKSCFVSHTKHIAEATSMDLFHS